MSFPPAEIAYEEAHINDNRAYQQIVPLAVFGSVAFACVVARPIARRSGRVPLGLDDWLIIAAMFFGIGLVITTGLTTKYGVGRHILAVPPPDLLKLGQVNFALQIFYVPTLALAKLSILALYVRIFRMTDRWFRFSVYVIAAYIVLWAIGVYLDILLTCRPISKYWKANCAPTYSTSVSTGVLNIISDVAVLLLPQPQVWKLQMPLKRKIGVSIITMLGVLATALSIARIPLLKVSNQGGSPDLTYHLITTYVLTVCEPMTIIICACLPIIASLYRKAYGANFGLSSLRSLLQGGRSPKSGSGSGSGSGSAWSKIQVSSDLSQTTHSAHSRERPLRDEEQGTYELDHLAVPKTGEFKTTAVGV